MGTKIFYLTVYLSDNIILYHLIKKDEIFLTMQPEYQNYHILVINYYIS